MFEACGEVAGQRGHLGQHQRGAHAAAQVARVAALLGGACVVGERGVEVRELEALMVGEPEMGDPDRAPVLKRGAVCDGAPVVAACKRAHGDCVEGEAEPGRGAHDRQPVAAPFGRVQLPEGIKDYAFGIREEIDPAERVEGPRELVHPGVVLLAEPAVTGQKSVRKLAKRCPCDRQSHAGQLEPIPHRRHMQRAAQQAKVITHG